MVEMPQNQTKNSKERLIAAAHYNISNIWPEDQSTDRKIIKTVETCVIQPLINDHQLKLL